ncbi:hypothetical protein [Hymenobacter glacieicola]|uniref:Uncharacterized protein n=1 Tax=Hymenobacter glacieicola TaxID=1562124 RepID=A0ABQ1WTW0_9BACT|nr:hypothetical protein [Hymenobacter glacieicola]GGG45508.1 hypothetical protein GCM10011378_22170 [Hymenobacter glacieicola]
MSACFWGDEYAQEQIIGDYYASGLKGSWGEPMSAAYLHFNDEEFGLADALLPETLSAAGASERCIILKGTHNEYYVAKIIPGATREVARRNIFGPFNRQAFKQNLQTINGDTLVSFTHRYTI